MDNLVRNGGVDDIQGPFTIEVNTARHIVRACTLVVVGDRGIGDQHIGAVRLNHILGFCGIREPVGSKQHTVDQHGTGCAVLFDHRSGRLVEVDLGIRDLHLGIHAGGVDHRAGRHVVIDLGVGQGEEAAAVDPEEIDFCRVLCHDGIIQTDPVAGRLLGFDQAADLVPLEQYVIQIQTGVAADLEQGEIFRFNIAEVRFFDRQAAGTGDFCDDCIALGRVNGAVVVLHELDPIQGERTRLNIEQLEVERRCFVRHERTDRDIEQFFIRAVTEGSLDGDIHIAVKDERHELAVIRQLGHLDRFTVQMFRKGNGAAAVGNGIFDRFTQRDFVRDIRRIFARDVHDQTVDGGIGRIGTHCRNRHTALGHKTVVADLVLIDDPAVLHRAGIHRGTAGCAVPDKLGIEVLRVVDIVFFVHGDQHTRLDRAGIEGHAILEDQSAVPDLDIRAVESLCRSVDQRIIHFRAADRIQIQVLFFLLQSLVDVDLAVETLPEHVLDRGRVAEPVIVHIGQHVAFPEDMCLLGIGQSLAVISEFFRMIDHKIVTVCAIVTEVPTGDIPEGVAVVSGVVMISCAGEVTVRAADLGIQRFDEPGIGLFHVHHGAEVNGDIQRFRHLDQFVQRHIFDHVAIARGVEVVGGIFQERGVERHDQVCFMIRFIDLTQNDTVHDFHGRRTVQRDHAAVNNGAVHDFRIRTRFHGQEVGVLVCGGVHKDQACRTGKRNAAGHTGEVGLADIDRGIVDRVQVAVDVHGVEGKRVFFRLRKDTGSILRAEDRIQSAVERVVITGDQRGFKGVFTAEQVIGVPGFEFIQEAFHVVAVSIALLDPDCHFHIAHGGVVGEGRAIHTEHDRGVQLCRTHGVGGNAEVAGRILHQCGIDIAVHEDQRIAVVIHGTPVGDAGSHINPGVACFSGRGILIDAHHEAVAVQPGLVGLGFRDLEQIVHIQFQIAGIFNAEDVFQRDHFRRGAVAHRLEVGIAFGDIEIFDLVQFRSAVRIGADLRHIAQHVSIGQINAGAGRGMDEVVAVFNQQVVHEERLAAGKVHCTIITDKGVVRQVQGPEGVGIDRTGVIIFRRIVQEGVAFDTDRFKLAVAADQMDGAACTCNGVAVEERVADHGIHHGCGAHVGKFEAGAGVAGEAGVVDHKVRRAVQDHGFGGFVTIELGTGDGKFGIFRQVRINLFPCFVQRRAVVAGGAVVEDNDAFADVLFKHGVFDRHAGAGEVDRAITVGAEFAVHDFQRAVNICRAGVPDTGIVFGKGAVCDLQACAFVGDTRIQVAADRHAGEFRRAAGEDKTVVAGTFAVQDNIRQLQVQIFGAVADGAVDIQTADGEGDIRRTGNDTEVAREGETGIVRAACDGQVIHRDCQVRADFDHVVCNVDDLVCRAVGVGGFHRRFHAAVVGGIFAVDQPCHVGDTLISTGGVVPVAVIHGRSGEAARIFLCGDSDLVRIHGFKGEGGFFHLVAFAVIHFDLFGLQGVPGNIVQRVCDPVVTGCAGCDEVGEFQSGFRRFDGLDAIAAEGVGSEGGGIIHAVGAVVIGERAFRIADKAVCQNSSGGIGDGQVGAFRSCAVLVARDGTGEDHECSAFGHGDRAAVGSGVVRNRAVHQGDCAVDGVDGAAFTGGILCNGGVVGEEFRAVRHIDRTALARGCCAADGHLIQVQACPFVQQDGTAVGAGTAHDRHAADVGSDAGRHTEDLLCRSLGQRGLAGTDQVHGVSNEDQIMDRVFAVGEVLVARSGELQAAVLGGDDVLRQNAVVNDRTGGGIDGGAIGEFHVVPEGDGAAVEQIAGQIHIPFHAERSIAADREVVQHVQVDLFRQRDDVTFADDDRRMAVIRRHKCCAPAVKSLIIRLAGDLDLEVFAAPFQFTGGTGGTEFRICHDLGDAVAVFHAAQGGIHRAEVAQTVRAAEEVRPDPGGVSPARGGGGPDRIPVFAVQRAGDCVELGSGIVGVLGQHAVEQDQAVLRQVGLPDAVKVDIAFSVSGQFRTFGTVERLQGHGVRNAGGSDHFTGIFLAVHIVLTDEGQVVVGGNIQIVALVPGREVFDHVVRHGHMTAVEVGRQINVRTNLAGSRLLVFKGVARDHVVDKNPLGGGLDSHPGIDRRRTDARIVDCNDLVVHDFVVDQQHRTAGTAGTGGTCLTPGEHTA